MGGTQRATLIEKSSIARKLGGAGFIRRLPMEDRLRVTTRIGFELGREGPAKKCASRVFSIMRNRGAEPEHLAETAVRHGLDFEFPRALYFAREADPSLDYSLRRADNARSSQDHNGVKQWATVSIRDQLSLGNHNIARCISSHYGLREGELKKIAGRLFKKEMGNTNYDSAEWLASSFKLPGERKKARIASVISDIREEKFSSAEKKAERWGFGKKFLRKAAVSIWNELMAEGQFLRAIKVAEWGKIFAERNKAALAEFRSLNRENENLKAALHAKEYGLAPQMKTAGGKVVRAELKAGQDQAAMSHAKDFCLQKLAQRIGKKLISAKVKKEDYLGAAKIAAECGDESARRELLLRAVQIEMENESRFRALKIAVSSGLEQEAKEIAREFFLSSISAGDYQRARKFAEKTGLEDALKMLRELERLLGPRR